VTEEEYGQCAYDPRREADCHPLYQTHRQLLSIGNFFPQIPLALTDEALSAGLYAILCLKKLKRLAMGLAPNEKRG
jgi:hypothetical protein